MSAGFASIAASFKKRPLLHHNLVKELVEASSYSGQPGLVFPLMRKHPSGPGSHVSYLLPPSARLVPLSSHFLPGRSAAIGSTMSLVNRIEMVEPNPTPIGNRGGNPCSSQRGSHHTTTTSAQYTFPSCTPYDSSESCRIRDLDQAGPRACRSEPGRVVLGP